MNLSQTGKEVTRPARPQSDPHSQRGGDLVRGGERERLFKNYKKLGECYYLFQ